MRCVFLRGIQFLIALIFGWCAPGCSNPFGASTDTPSLPGIGAVSLPPLFGSGISRASLISSPSSRDFGMISTNPLSPGPTSQVFSISNTGTPTATQVVVGISGAGFSLTSNHCGTSSTPGTLDGTQGTPVPCTVEVTYLPTTGAGASSGLLNLFYDDGSGTQQNLSIALSAHTNEPPVLTAPSSRLFPLTASPSGPVTQGETVSFTPVISDSEGDSTTVACTVESFGASATDPNAILSGTSCSNLESLVQTAGVISIGVAQFTAATGTLTWQPTSSQRGTYRITMTASDAYGSGTPKSFFVSIREPFASQNLVLALDASLADVDAMLATATNAIAPRIDGSIRDGHSAWTDLLGNPVASLAGFFTSPNPWLGEGSYLNPYSLEITGAQNDRLSLGSTMVSATKFSFDTWVKASHPETTGSIILGNGGGVGAGFILSQTTNPHSAEAGKVEFQIGKGSYQNYILRDQPLSYWRLGEHASSTVAVDLGSEGFNLNYSPLLTKETPGALLGDSNTSVTFPGTNDAEIESSAALPTSFLTQTYTYELWFRMSTIPAGQDIILMLGSYNSGNQYIQVVSHPNGTSLRVQALSFGSSGWIINSGGGPLTLNEWHHVAATRDPVENKMRLFIDGQSYSNVGMPIPSIANYGTGARGMAIGGSSLWHLYNHAGELDEVAIYGYAFTAQQALNHYNAGKNLRFPVNNILSYGPKFFYRLDEVAGGTAYDTAALATGGTGTYAASANYTNVNLDRSSSHADNADGSVEFLGGGSRLSGIGNSTMIRFFENGGKFLVSFWAKPADYLEDPGYEPILLSSAASSSSKGMQIRYQPADHRYMAQLHNGTSVFGVVSSGVNSINDSNWHHIAYQGDGVNATMYLDGVATQTVAISAFGTGSSSSDLTVGALSSGSQSFRGFMDDLAIWHRPLTSGDIHSIMTATNYLGCQSTTSLGSFGSASAANWTNLAGLWDGALLQIFVNGRLECSVNPALAGGAYTTASSNLFMGGNASSGSFWSGLLADAKIYATADGSSPITAPLIKSNFNATANRFREKKIESIVDQQLILMFDPANASRGLESYVVGCASSQLKFFDLSPFAFDGRLNGFSSSDCLGAVADGWRGTGTTLEPYRLKFDGINDRVDIPGLGLPTSASLDFWVKPALGSDMTLLSIGSTPRLTVSILTSGRIQITQGGVTVSSSFALVDQAWTHLNIAFDGSTVSFYKNGAATADMALSFTHTLVSGNSTLGSLPGGTQAFNGSLGPLLIYSTNLSDTQISQNCHMFSGRFGASCN